MTDLLKIESPAFDNGGYIPPKYTSDGENINPPIKISGVSDQAKSLVLIIDDPDAATDPDGPGMTFDHWVLFSIDASTSLIDENSIPPGAIQGQNGLGQSQYIGPAPPNGIHRYFFNLYELKGKLDLNQNATKIDVLSAIDGLTTAKAELIGIYKKA